MLNLPITYRGTVYPWHCDHMNHMNVMWYVGKFDEATWQFFSGIGLSRSDCRRKARGWRPWNNALSTSELHAGDVITIRSAALEITEKSIRFCHEMANDETGELAARTILVGVYFDTSARKSRPIPADIRERVGLMLTPT